MKLKHAIEVLLHAAKRDLTGAGCGIRENPSGEQRKEIIAAMQRAGEYAYGDWYEAPPY